MTAQLSREQLKTRIEKALKDFTEGRAAMHVPPLDTDVDMVLADCLTLLAGMDSEPVATLDVQSGRPDGNKFALVYSSVAHRLPDDVYYLHTVPPAPVALPDVLSIIERHAERLEKDGRAAEGFAEDQRKRYAAAMLRGVARECRAAMLKHGTLTNEGTISGAQIKPVADLYGITSPTGSETSFTFDAVEARNFIDGGWSCQEYVELERYQAAMQSFGNSEQLVSPRYMLQAGLVSSVKCWCRSCRPISLTGARFVVCPECGNKRCPHANDHRNACTGSNEPGQPGSAYPGAPEQEV